jgi:hypothetical protein
MPIKSWKKLNLNKKNWRDSSLRHNKLILRSKTFLPLDLIFRHGFNISLIYSGSTKNITSVSKLGKLPEELLGIQKTQKAAVFLFERTWALEWFKILIKLKILILFVHSKSQSRMESPPKMKQFFNFIFCFVNSSVIYERKHLKLQP